MRNKKSFFIVGAVLFSLIFIILVLFFLNYFSQTSINKRSFEQSISSLSDDINEINFNDLIPFDWDTLYYFSGYSSTEYIDDILGFKSHIKPTHQEGRSNIIFVKDDKIVCHLVNGDNKEYYFEINKNEAIINSHSDSSFILTRRDGCLIFTIK